MTHWRRTRTLLVAAAILAAAFGLPGSAVAQGHGGHGGYGGGHGGGYGGHYGGPVFVARGFYPFYPYYGFGYGFGPYFGPYWGPWGYGGYGPPGGIDMSAAFAAGYGAIDLNSKPGAAEVWVDGKFVAEAKDLDGYPSYLWLPEGAHHVIVYKGGYARFEEDVEVQRGYTKELKVRLEKGESQPPGLRPGKTEPGKKEEPAKTDTKTDTKTL